MYQHLCFTGFKHNLLSFYIFNCFFETLFGCWKILQDSQYHNSSSSSSSFPLGSSLWWWSQPNIFLHLTPSSASSSVSPTNFISLFTAPRDLLFALLLSWWIHRPCVHICFYFDWHFSAPVPTCLHTPLTSYPPSPLLWTVDPKWFTSQAAVVSKEFIRFSASTKHCEQLWTRGMITITLKSAQKLRFHTLSHTNNKSVHFT